jgi:hypothetical protein
LQDCAYAAPNGRGMHNRALHESLAAFVQEAAQQLAEEVSAGAEVPFELAEAGRSASPLYCYRPQTDRFIAERLGVLARLPAYPGAAHQLAGVPDLEAYLQARGRRTVAREPRAQADAALLAFLGAVWAQATEFVFDPERFAAAYRELEEAAYQGCALALVVAPVEGLVLESDEVLLGGDLALARASTLGDLPGDLRGDAYATVAVLRLQSGPGEGPALAAAGRRLRHLQTALRLWDSAEPAVGPVAWARADRGGWLLTPLAGGARRAVEDCLVSAEEEDVLRAFCSLVARRTPRSGELAWALRRFELGCERPTALEAMTDWLLAARALLGDALDVGSERALTRLAAICHAPHAREPALERLLEGAALERRAIAGVARPEREVETLAAELGDALRAVLRDILCGHLDPDVRRVADAMAPEEPAAA